MDNIRIRIEIGNRVFAADLHQTPTANNLLDALPIKSSAITWGDEIYFGVPFSSPLEADARTEVDVGALAYWPTMPAFCIFFGPTPASHGSEPRAASPVNVFGRLLDVDVEQLRAIRDGEQVVVSRAEEVSG